MSLAQLELKESYRSNEDNMVRDFYNPVLSSSVRYRRAVGYFTLNSLVNAAQGLSSLIENGGTVQIIASPKLTEKDVEVINTGYKMREDVYLDAMIREISDIKSPLAEERLNYIATLIADGSLDIKIATMDNTGAYHEKFGLVEDVEGNKILFIGSMNETASGQYTNFESFVVLESWVDNLKSFVEKYDDNFSKLWNDETAKLKISDFPSAVRKKLLEYQKPYIKPEGEDGDGEDEDGGGDDTIEVWSIDKYPKLPEWFDPREYQEEAVEHWRDNNYRGLFSMATGTGKTLTGLLGLTTLYNEQRDKSRKLASIIVCPYQHLVEQWAEDVRQFNIDPILCYSKYHDWRDRVYRKIKYLNNGTIDNFTFIATNATFKTKAMQEFIKTIRSDILLIVDEAHNASQSQMRGCLTDEYQYRLGLSATPRKYRDDEATEFIFDYFGGEVFSYDLETAIRNGFLTQYYYYPHIVRLTETEQDIYDDLTAKIMQNIKEENGKTIINDFAKNLLIKRARLVAGATNKLSVLRELMAEHKNTNYMLVYCGATRTTDVEKGDEEDFRQIEKVCRILGNEYGIANRMFTANESPDERSEIIDMFSDGRSLQAIVAIKCLDEGVNIPAIQHAFIMASGTDPKEFIQRRGRVLRKYEKNGERKEYAYIHDFITLPCGMETGKTLVETELKRYYEFNSLAVNKVDNEDLMWQLIDDYAVDYNNVKNAFDKFNIGELEDYE